MLHVASLRPVLRGLLLGCCLLAIGCGAGGGGGGGGGGLSPARDILGTWGMLSTVDVYMTSNGCGTYARYNRTPILMTWVISDAGGNEVNVDMYANHIGSTTQIGSHCGAPSFLNFPVSLRGIVSSSRLQLVEAQMQYDDQGRALGLADVMVGDFHFTTNNLAGTIFYSSCPIYCAGFETDQDACILTR